MPLTQSRSFDNNAGLGLGLPSTFASTSAGRSASAKTITASTSAHFDDSYLFPMPSKSRAVSAETVRVSINEISYWSPNSEEEYEDDDEDCQSEEDYGEVVESSPESQLLATPEEASPLVAPHMKLEAHACLHLLSPKVDAFAQAVMNQGFSSDEAVESALEWAWLVPMVDSAVQIATTSPVFVPRPAPTMSHQASVSSFASSISLGSSVDETPDRMARTHSVISSFSSISAATSATSVASKASIMDRKRPIGGAIPASNRKVIKLRASSSRFDLDRAPATPVKEKPLPAAPAMEATASCSSTRSKATSIFSPTDEEFERLFQPMNALPSPYMTRSSVIPCAEDGFSSSLTRKESQASMASTSSIGNTGARLELYEIWYAAEEAERARRANKLQKKQPQPALPASPSDVSRVNKWVSRIRTSTSMASLRSTAATQAKNDTNEDAASVVEVGGQKFEMCFEPRAEKLESRRESIDAVLEHAAPRAVQSKKSNDNLWKYLG